MKYKITYSTTESLTLETPEICSISDLNGVAQVMAEQLRKDIKIISWEKIEKVEKVETPEPMGNPIIVEDHEIPEESNILPFPSHTTPRDH
jgi:hypothetical protein